MKKILLSLAFALVASFAHAQGNTLEIMGHNFSTVFVYNNTPHNIGIDKTFTMVEKPDGDLLLCNLFRRKLTPTSSTYVNIGDGFYTISRQDLVVTDSTFLESNLEYIDDNNGVLLVHNPVGEGYIWARFLTNRYFHPGFDGFTWLEIFHSDEDLNFDNEPVMVHLEDTRIESSNGIMLENEENLVVRYVSDGVPVFARIGLDGTLKDKQPMPGLFQGGLWNINGMVTYSDSPREYAVYGWDTTPEGDTTFLFHVIDSMFNLQETVVMENQSGHYHFFNNMVSMLPYDGQTYYVISQYTKDNEPRNGMRVTKYDKSSHEELKEIMISSQPVFTNLNYCALPFGFKKSEDGALYLAYRTSNNPSKGYITVLKLDTDMNTIWERRCYTLNNYESIHFCRMETIEKGIAVCAQHHKVAYYEGDYPFNTILFFIHDDGIVGTPESEAFVRPYLFYPNPAQDLLHLQYSPDVKPTRVELYDMQGRLVHTQSEGIESINLQGLAPGQYLMKVTLEDGKTYSDKVVKE